MPLSRQDTLVKRADLVHTCRDLAAVLWPDEADVRSNRVAVAISSLRGEFGKAGIQQPFLTVRGVGLKLKDTPDLEAGLLTS